MPISLPDEEVKNQLIESEEEEDAYKAKASGMGQTRGMSIVSSEEEQNAMKPNSGEHPKLIDVKNTSY